MAQQNQELYLPVLCSLKQVQADGSEEAFHFSGAAATLQEALKVDMVDMHLEEDIIPVSDVERSKRFYGRLG